MSCVLVWRGAQVEANATFDFAKSQGSRAGGLPGDAGARVASRGALSAPSTSASAKRKKPRLTTAVRISEIMMLTQQIPDGQKALEAKRRLVDQKRQRGTMEDLESAVMLSREIIEDQQKVRAAACAASPCRRPRRL